jgi:ABC-type lipoprotein export system ATPase subunit
LDLEAGQIDISLSGGEQKRISIVREMLNKKSVMIFDEPLANLDKENVKKIENSLLDMKEMTLIVLIQIISDNNKARFDGFIHI